MKSIWIKRGIRTNWIKNVEAFEIKSSMELDGNIVPVSTRFVCKHGDGGFSVTPVPNLLELQWGIVHGDGIHRPDRSIQSAS